jgi:outer membrane lipoprotein-sorting protein
MPRSAKVSTTAALLLAVVLAAAPLAVAENEPIGAAELVSGLQGWLDATRDLRGRFEQRLLSGALGSDLAESGEFWIARPGRMRWDYTDPERKVAIVDGDRTWLFLEEEEELILGRLEDQGELLPGLLAGGGRIEERFEVSVLAEPRRGGGGAYQLLLVPRGGDQAFENVVVVLRPPRYAIEALEVLDAAGNRVFYRFYDLRRNRGLSDRLFLFSPPEGTSVIGTH